MSKKYQEYKGFNLPNVASEVLKRWKKASIKEEKYYHNLDFRLKIIVIYTFFYDRSSFKPNIKQKKLPIL